MAGAPPTPGSGPGSPPACPRLPLSALPSAWRFTLAQYANHTWVQPVQGKIEELGGDE